ncbi:MAG: alpha/beta hydrolase, partial [Armatimonadota bacterium]|nr:alpha/beta hydrolase [Armatimonadota bacterium]
MKLPLLRSIGTAAAAGAALFLVVRRFEDDLIFWPWRRLRGTPQDHGLLHEDVVLEPAPGIRIRGWFVEHSSPRGVVLYLEGNGANRSTRLGHVAMLHSLGYSVLIMDYEGYGDSDGRPSEHTVYRDARAARKWLAQDPRTKNLPQALFGESLGGAVSLALAREDPPQAVIVDHSFSTMADMINRVCRGVPLSRICRSRYNSLENVREYHGPILIMHGDADRFIPIEQGRRLFEAANEPKTFLTVPGAGHDHNEVLRVGGETYRETVRQFLEKTLVNSDADEPALVGPATGGQWAATHEA